MKSKIENCLYMQVAHCNKCGGQSGYNIIDGEKVCFDCGEPYEADFSVSKVETTITTTNSQDQEEENTVCEGCGKTITSRFMQSYTKGDGMHSYCLSCDPKKQDTPEQKEEWEEELGKLMSTWGKVLFVNKGRIGAGMQTAMYLKFYHFIKNLLSEREVFTKEELFMLKLAMNDIHNKGNSAYDEISEKIKRELDKLTTK